MQRILSTAMLFICAGVLLSGCDIPSSTANRPAEGEMTSGRLKDEVQARLNADPQLKEANLDVDADASKNSVSLSGTVESEALRSRAVELAKATRTGLTIDDKIDVKPREVSRTGYTEDQAKSERDRAKDTGDKVGSSLDDAWVHMKIVSKLIGNSKTPERKINVDVVDQNVTLRGTVDTAEQKTEAERVAKDTDGVKNVQNLLKVSRTGAA